MSNLNLFFVLLICKTALTSTDFYEHRNLTTKVISSANTSRAYLVHTQAEGQGDVLHYLYTTLSSPSILLIKTIKTASLHVDWPKFSSSNATEQEKSITVKGGKVLASSILSLQNLYVYDDPTDQADMQIAKNNLSTIPLHTLPWNLYVSGNIVEFKSEKESVNGSRQVITIQMQASSNIASTTDLPHLLTTNNLTVIDVTLDNVNNGVGYAPVYEHPRLGVGMVMMVNGMNYKVSDVIKQDSLDDTLAPGSFRTINWLSEKLINNSNPKAASNADNREVFVQWRPICYTDQKKSLQTYTIVRDYPLERLNHSSDLMALSLATAFYGSSFLDEGVHTSRLNVSFGVGKDKWYSKTNYTTWKLTYGIGEHPIKSFSLLIILLITLGLGIPAFLLLALAIYVLIKRCCTVHRHGYEEISSSYPQIV